MGMKSRLGNPPIRTYASASEVFIPDDVKTVHFSGSTTIDKILTGTIRPGRDLLVIGLIGGSYALANNNDPTVVGHMDNGGSNVTVAGQTTCLLTQKSNGTWVRTGGASN